MRLAADSVAAAPVGVQWLTTLPGLIVDYGAMVGARTVGAGAQRLATCRGFDRWTAGGLVGSPGPWSWCAKSITLPGLIVDCGGLVGSQDRGAAAQGRPPCRV